MSNTNTTEENQEPLGSNNEKQQADSSKNPEPEQTVESVNPAYESFSEEIETKAQENAHPSKENNNKQQNKADEKLEGLQQYIHKLEEQLSITKDQMVRALAEAENTRKRAIKEREDASKYAVSNFARDIVSVADNLRRALDAMPAEILAEFPQVKNLIDGIDATERELLRSFHKNGISKIEPLGEKFDPHFHEVMFEAPVPGKETGIIIQIVEPGYMINGRILRPARVGIAKSTETSSSEKPGSSHTVDTEA